LCVGCGISVRREFAIGFTSAAILAAGISAVLGWFVLPIFFAASTIVTVSIVTFCSVILGITGGLSAAHTAQRNIRSRRDQIASIRQDMNRGIAFEYSGNIAESFFNTEANPEHPDMCVRFINGDEVVLTAFDQSQHDLYRLPKKWVRVVILPGSQLIVTAKAV